MHDDLRAKKASDLVDPSPFDDLLRVHVRRGLIDYRTVATRRFLLDGYLKKVSQLSRSKLDKASRRSQLAFYINTYNALTWKAILNHYPISEKISSGFLRRVKGPANSIRQIPGVWNRTTHTVGGEFLTLDDIEHKILRKLLKEPRIHFALVCAALSCPLLRPEAYRASKIEQQLDDDVRRFAQDPGRVLVDLEANSVGLSKILNWYRDDFSDFKGLTPRNKHLDKGLRNVLGLMATYLPQEERRFVLEETYKVYYFDYDWTLNDISERETR